MPLSRCPSLCARSCWACTSRSRWAEHRTTRSPPDRSTELFKARPSTRCPMTERVVLFTRADQEWQRYRHYIWSLFTILGTTAATSDLPSDFSSWPDCFDELNANANANASASASAIARRATPETGVRGRSVVQRVRRSADSSSGADALLVQALIVRSPRRRCLIAEFDNYGASRRRSECSSASMAVLAALRT